MAVAGLVALVGVGCSGGGDGEATETDPSRTTVVDPSAAHAALRAEPAAAAPTQPPTAGPSDRAALRPVAALTISEEGAVVEDVDVAGRIEIRADDVTVRNFRAWGVTIDSARTGIVLEDGEIHGGDDPGGDGVGFANYTARRLDVHGVTDGFKAHGNVLIEDCYVHDLAVSDGPDGVSHNDGVQVSGGYDVVIRTSWFERVGTNAAVFVKPDLGPIQNVTIESNFLDGGGYTLSVMPAPTDHPTSFPMGVLVRANRFGDGWEYHPAITLGPGITFEADNVDAAGVPVEPFT